MARLFARRALASVPPAPATTKETQPMPTRSVAARLFAFAAVAALVAGPVRAVASATNIVYGYVQHVSSDNLKIAVSKTHESLSFLIVPKFDQVFSSDGKTTYQMSALKPGTFVKVYYDQKGLGARHADKIYVYKSNSEIPSGAQ